ncbi:ATP-binding protein [Pseudomonas canadensis]|uniref:ATP-binding protein n=1 Tax=Pseudomonas canadensis TaxID=915099 RepID=UPI003BA07674
MKYFRLNLLRPQRETGKTPDLSGRHYRRLLIGGGIAVSFAILVVSLVETTLLIERFFYERKQVFVDQLDMVKGNLENHQARLRQTVEAYELLWGFHDNEEVPAANYRQRLQNNRGGVVTDSDVTVTPFALFSSLDRGVTEAHLKTFLRLAREISPSPLLRQSHTGYFLGGFTYSTDRRLLAVWPSLSAEKMNKIRNEGTGLFIDSYIDRVEREMNRIPPQVLRQQRVVWISLYRSPISGDLVTDYAVPVYHDGERVAVVVATIPFDRFSQLFQDSTHETGFFVVSRDRQHIFGGDESQCDVCLMQSIFDSPAVLRHSGQQADIIRRDGFFFMAQRISGPNWIAVYVFDWYSVLLGLRYKLVVVVLLTLAVLGCLWGFILLLDRLVFKPLRSQSRQIYESEAFNRMVLAAAPVGLAVYDPFGDTVVMQNEAAQNLLSRSSENDSLYPRIVAMRHWPQRTHPGARTNEHEPTTVETTLKANDGTQIDVAITLSGARYQQREVILIKLTDVSDQKATVRLLRCAREAADQASQAKSMFLASMSHEIRTPLHGALGNLELLAMEQLTALQRERVQVIRRAFDALLALINNILDLSKIEAHELELNIESFSIDDLIERCAQTFAPSMVKKNVDFLCLVDPRLAGVWTGDGHRLTQVVLNLLSNAIKFTEKGSITLRARPGKVRDGFSWVSISVSDTGIGISLEKLEGVFEPFVQADIAIDKRFGGTGLGLTLCRRILNLMGGNIKVDSEEGEGSIFTVDVPLIHDCSSESHVKSSDNYCFGTVVVICDSLLWRINLIAQIQCWYPKVKVIEAHANQAFSASDANSILVYATLGPSLPTCWYEVQFTYLGSVVLSGDGPLYPERRGKTICVTSLSTSMFQLALKTCGNSVELDPYIPNNTRSNVARRAAQILIVEDEPVNRTLLEHQLAALGYDHVDSVTDGSEALAHCRRKSYDVIVTDLEMPVMSGDTFLKMMRAEGSTIPVILSTAATGDSAQMKTLDFSEILYKPITIDQLEAALNRVLYAELSPGRRLAPHRSTTSAQAGMQALFIAGWESDERALREALESRDSQRFLGRLHRLKGALLALGEKSSADACEELYLQVEAEGIEGARSAAEGVMAQLLALIVRVRNEQTDQ